jgi:IS1 family transposase
MPASPLSSRVIRSPISCSFNTVAKLLVDAGTVCAAFHDEKVRSVKSKSLQADEVWSFNYCKSKNVRKASSAPEGAGAVWTWTAIDADSKLIVSWLVGSRDSNCAYQFLRDLRMRVDGSPQITTDGHKPYISAMQAAFGDDVDYAMLIKLFGPDIGSERRYSPPVCTGTITNVISGKPNEKHINTSFAERQNLTMRMSMRRFTRLTNAFSKKFENHCHALALYFYWYNWVRQHKTLRVSPAMAAGLTGSLMDMEQLVHMIDVRERMLLQEKRERVLAA